MQVKPFFIVISIMVVISVFNPGSALGAHKPDLIVSLINSSNPSPCASENFNLQITLQNIGQATAPGSTVGIRVGGNTNIQTLSVPSINPGKVQSVYLHHISLPSPMEYTITVFADHPNQIIEENEENNIKQLHFRVKEGCPDLEISRIFLEPPDPTNSRSFVCKVELKNKGVCTSKASLLGLRVGGETNLVSLPVPELQPGDYPHTFERRIIFNKTGQYTITAYADNLNQVSECNETNNSKKVSFTVTGSAGIVPLKPDLIVSVIHITPPAPIVEKQVRFQITVRNIGTAGAGPSKLGVVIGGNSSATEFAIPALGIEETQTVYVNASFSLCINYRIVAHADYGNQIEELNESNNTKSEFFIVEK